MSKFKVGDMVYCPQLSLNILKVKKNTAKDYYQLYIEKGSQRIYFCESGVIGILSKVTPVIHATQENYESLSRLYPNVEFEKPPVRKTPKEIIKAMFDSDWEYVPCYDVHSFYQQFLHKECEQIKECLAPFDPKTGKIIIDFVGGEIMTE